MGRLVDLDDLIEVGKAPILKRLAHQDIVTTYIRRYGDLPVLAIELAEGNCRDGVREGIERREEHT